MNFTARIKKTTDFVTFAVVVGLSLLAGTAGAQLNLQSQWAHAPITYPRSVAYSPDGSLLALAGNGGVQIYATKSNSLEKCLCANIYTNSIAFSPNGKTLVGCSGGTIQLWDVATGSLSNSIVIPTATVIAVALSPDGSTIAACETYYGQIGSPLATVQTYSVSTGKLLESVSSSQNSLVGIAYSPNGKSIATCGSSPSGGLVQILDAQSLKTTLQEASPAGVVQTVTFSPDGKTLADGGGVYDGNLEEYQGVLELRIVSTGALKSSLKVGLGAVESVAYSPNGEYLAEGGASGSVEGGAEMWQVSSGKLLGTVEDQIVTSITAVTFSSNGKTLATAGTAEGAAARPGYAILDFWTAPGAKLSARINPQADNWSTVSLAVSPNSSLVALGGLTYDESSLLSNNWIGLWNTSGGNMTKSLVPGGFPLSLAFTPDGKMLADGGYGPSNGSGSDGVLELWDLATGKLVYSYSSALSRVENIAISSDGTLLADEGEDNSVTAFQNLVEVWSITTGKQVCTFSTNFQQGIGGFAFSPVGKTLAIAGIAESSLGYQYGAIELFDASSGALTETLYPGVTNPYSVAFSADGKSIAVGGQQYEPSTEGFYAAMEARNVDSGNLIASYAGVAGSSIVDTVAFSADGGTIFAGTWADLRAFDTTTGSLLNIFPLGGVNSVLALSNETQLAVLTAGGQFIMGSNPYVPQSTVAAVSLNPVAVVGGKSSIGTVSLTGKAPSGGLKVSLSSSSITASVPKFVLVPAGKTWATFTVETKGVKTGTSATITATSGVTSTSTVLTIS